METVATRSAPEAIGPYSQAIIANGFVFASGQIALDPASMDIVGSDAAEQTERVMQNLAAVLDEAGTTLDNVVKTTVYLSDMGDFSSMNGVYERHFGTHKPARATVAVRELPKGVRVEIDAIAIRG